MIGADGSVQMEINKVLIVFQGKRTIDGNEQPIIGKREANSTITVSDKEKLPYLQDFNKMKFLIKGAIFSTNWAITRS